MVRAGYNHMSAGLREHRQGYLVARNPVFSGPDL